MAYRQGELHMWTDNDTELLLNISQEYKDKKA